MKNSKLWNAIQELGEVDLKRLSHTIDTPLFNGRKYHRNAFNIIHKAIHSGKELSRENLSDKLFGRNNYNDVRMRLIMSDLLKMVEQYIIMQYAVKNKGFADVALLRYYREKGNDKLFKSTLSGVLAKKEKRNFHNDDHYESLSKIAMEEYEYISSNQHGLDLNLDQIHHTMDTAYIARKLRYSCLAHIHSTDSGTQYSNPFSKEIIQYVRQSELIKIPVIETYYYCHLMVNNPEDLSVFQKFRKKIVAYAHIFPKEELRSLYLIAINQCIRKLNDGNMKFGKVGIDLYQKALEGKYLLINGNLSHFTYRNVVVMAIKTGNFSWAESFSREHKHHLHRDHRESSFHFNMALICYHKKKYDQALDNIKKTEFKDNWLSLAVKTLQLKIYLESGEIKLLQSHLDAMEMFLLRIKIAGNPRKNYQNLIRYTKKLLKVNSVDKNALAMLKAEIDQQPNLTEKKWLLGQLN